MTSKRKIREFQRLLYHSDTLNDIELLKLNATELGKKYSDLIKDNLLTPEQEKVFSEGVRRIQNKTSPKVDVPKQKPKPHIKNSSTNDEKDVSKERMRHNELTNDLLELTGQLKENVAKVSVKVAEDEEVLNSVEKNMEYISNGADKTSSDMNVTVGERLGWRAYKYLIIVVAVYILVTTIF